MKRHVHIAIALWILFLTLVSATSVPAADKSLRFSGIPAQALTADGRARVIAGFAVEEYAALAETAAHYKVVTPDEAKTDRRAAFSADAALAAAITQSMSAVLSSLPAESCTVTRTYSALPFVALSVTSEGLEALRADPRVSSIEIDAPTPVPEPMPAALSSKGSNLNWGPPKIGADVAWARGYTGAGWYVAVLDTGIRSTHEFFAGKNIIEACYSASGDCPGGASSAFGPGSAVHYPSTYDGYDHGTHCAGIATGSKADGTANGVAKDANLIAIQIFSKTGDTSISSWKSDQLAALNYVYSLRNTVSIAAASMSLGGGVHSGFCDSDFRKAGIDLLRSVNIATAIATGNEESCTFINDPACISSAIAVGSSTSEDVRSSFSNWHPTLQTIFAPGSGIYSSTGASDASYASWDGTSMATPHVAGAWAILRQNRPNDSVSTILARVLAAGATITVHCISTDTNPRLYIPGALREKSAASPAPAALLLLGD
ncbi:S8 family serine peptidase [Desulfolutivibrio sp.]|uniref:S8 family serine peptidase n=1 Tax=Desulfolutivibrio sp. TaxID=2773296 RepID=UPI002F966B55